jgi:predicted nucleic acid-binding protein
MADLVISNTSPLFYLHRLGQLELLHKLYCRILVPEAVVEELKAGRDQGEDVPDIADHDWIVDTILRLAKE